MRFMEQAYKQDVVRYEKVCVSVSVSACVSVLCGVYVHTHTHTHRTLRAPCAWWPPATWTPRCRAVPTTPQWSPPVIRREIYFCVTCLWRARTRSCTPRRWKMIFHVNNNFLQRILISYVNNNFPQRIFAWFVYEGPRRARVRRGGTDSGFTEWSHCVEDLWECENVCRVRLGGAYSGKSVSCDVYY